MKFKDKEKQKKSEKANKLFRSRMRKVFKDKNMFKNNCKGWAE